MNKIIFNAALIFLAFSTGACTFYAGPFVSEVKMDGGRTVQKICMSKYESFIGETTLVDCEIKPISKLDKDERIAQ